MPLDPTIQAIVDQGASADGPKMSEQTPEQARAAYALVGALSGGPAALASIDNRTIPGSAGDLPIRVYRPTEDGPLPVILFFHGGGWTIGSVDTHDIPCQHLAALSGCIVVSVEYRLAPEHPFPAAVDDCWAALQWVAANASDLDGDGDRVGVAGDSAGGNLAAVMTHLAHDNGGPTIGFQGLVYPAVDASMSFPSIEDNGQVAFLTDDTMRWFTDQYAPDESVRDDPRISPMRRHDLSGLPPALVITAEYDPLRDEGEAYGKRLA
ncbi:MAG: alpha/beta hydrolase, partial [Acidimicrobiales bacterium]